MSEHTTGASSCARASAIARLLPELDLVTIATRSYKRLLMSISPLLCPSGALDYACVRDVWSTRCSTNQSRAGPLDSSKPLK